MKELGHIPFFDSTKQHCGKLAWSEKKQEGRFRYYGDETLKELDNLPDPGVLAQEIVEDLEAALEQFRLIAEDLGEEKVTNE
jgi:type I restriction enzyme M protein